MIIYIWDQEICPLGWHIHADYQHENYFPTKLFKGIVLLVDVEKAQPILDTLVTETRIDLTQLANRFCEHSDFGMMMEERRNLFARFFLAYIKCLIKLRGTILN